jgi:hypothetical protein
MEPSLSLSPAIDPDIYTHICVAKMYTAAQKFFCIGCSPVSLIDGKKLVETLKEILEALEKRPKSGPRRPPEGYGPILLEFKLLRRGYFIVWNLYRRSKTCFKIYRFKI